MTCRSWLRAFAPVLIVLLLAGSAASQSAVETRFKGTSVTVSPDGKWMAALTTNDSVAIRDTATWKEQRTFKVAKSVHTIAFASNDSIVLGGADQMILVDAATGKLVRKFGGGALVGRSRIAVSPDGKQVAFGGSFGPKELVGIWETSTGKKLHELKGSGAAFSPDGKRIATAGQGCFTWLWDSESGKQLAEYDRRLSASPGPRPLQISADGKTLVIGDRAALRFHDLEKASAIPSLKTDFYVGSVVQIQLQSIAVSPDGALIAVIQKVIDPYHKTEHAGFLLVDAKTRKLIHRGWANTSPKFAGNSSVAFTKDGKRIISEADGAIVIWNASRLLEEYALARGKALEEEAALQKELAKEREAAWKKSLWPEAKMPPEILNAERKLLEAKSLRIEYEVEFNQSFRVEGTLEATEGNRCRTEVIASIFHKDMKKFVPAAKSTEVSDGKENRATDYLEFDENGDLYEPVSDLFTSGPMPQVPKDYNKWLIQVVARQGLVSAYLESRSRQAVPFLGEFKQIHANPSVKEKLDGRDTICLQGKLEFKNQPEGQEKLAYSIWLDAATGLPVKRVLSDEKKDVFIERYRRIEINPKLDPKRFELSKNK